MAPTVSAVLVRTGPRGAVLSGVGTQTTLKGASSVGRAGGPGPRPSVPAAPAPGRVTQPLGASVCLRVQMGREEGALRDRAACLSVSGEGGVG